MMRVGPRDEPVVLCNEGVTIVRLVPSRHGVPIFSIFVVGT
jgi:hypothetical protein